MRILCLSVFVRVCVCVCVCTYVSVHMFACMRVYVWREECVDARVLGTRFITYIKACRSRNCPCIQFRTQVLLKREREPNALLPDWMQPFSGTPGTA
jgi:hypothetical protein